MENYNKNVELFEGRFLRLLATGLLVVKGRRQAACSSCDIRMCKVSLETLAFPLHCGELKPLGLGPGNTDQTHTWEELEEFLAAVGKYRTHPGLNMWSSNI